MECAQILSQDASTAIVQLPGRNFPGIVIQGDTLRSFLVELEELREEISRLSDAYLVLDGVIEQVRNHLDFYESTLVRANLDLPYVDPVLKEGE